MTVPPTPEYPPSNGKRAKPLRFKVAVGVAVAVIAAIVLAVVLTGGFHDDNDSPPRQPVPTENGAPEPGAKDQLTVSAVELAWESFTPVQQELACAELEAVGDAEAARRMEQGAGPSATTDAIDWDLAVDIIKGKCTELSGV